MKSYCQWDEKIQAYVVQSCGHPSKQDKLTALDVHLRLGELALAVADLVDLPNTTYAASTRMRTGSLSNST
jgi:hypothetical protein